MPRRSCTAIRLTRLPASTDATQPVSQLGRAVAALATAISNGEIQPCPVCQRFDCMGCNANEYRQSIVIDAEELPC